jgi:hypothetical protein
MNPPSCSIAAMRPPATACSGSPPSTLTPPASGRIRPSSSFTVVLLPAPFGPSSATVSPGDLQVDPVDRPHRAEALRHPASSTACSFTVRSLVDVVDASDATAGPHRQVVRPVTSWR